MPNVENEDCPDNFAKAVFCLDEKNLIVLDQVFDKNTDRYCFLQRVHNLLGTGSLRLLDGVIMAHIHPVMCMYFTSSVAN